MMALTTRFGSTDPSPVRGAASRDGKGLQDQFWARPSKSQGGVAPPTAHRLHREHSGIANTADCNRPDAVPRGVRRVWDFYLEALLDLVHLWAIRPIHGCHHALLINALVTKYCGDNALVHLEQAEKDMHGIYLTR